MTLPVTAAPRPAASPRAERDGRPAEGAGGFAAALSTMLRPDARRAGTPAPAGGTGTGGAAAADHAAGERQGDDADAVTASREDVAGDVATVQADAAANAVHGGAVTALIAPAMPPVPEGTRAVEMAPPVAEDLTGVVADATAPTSAADGATVTTQTGNAAGTAPALEAGGATTAEPVDGAAAGAPETVVAPEAGIDTPEPGADTPGTGVTAPHTTSETMRSAVAHPGDPTAHRDITGAADVTMSAPVADQARVAQHATEPTTPAATERAAAERGPRAADASHGEAHVTAPADTTDTADTQTADSTVAVPDVREAAPAPATPSQVTPAPGTDASLVVESADPAATIGTTQVRAAGETGGPAPAATPVVSRIVQLVERLRTEPPPQQLVVDLDQFGVGRLVISLRGDTVLVGAVDGGARPDPQWWRELGEALDQRGWSLDGRGGQPSRDRQQPQPQPQPHPASAFLAQPRRRVRSDRGLRL